MKPNLQSIIKAIERQLAVSTGLLERAGPKDRMATRFASLADEDIALFERWLSSTSVVLRDMLGHAESKQFRDSVRELRNGSSFGTFERCRAGHKHLDNLARIAREFPDQLTFTPPAIDRWATPAQHHNPRGRDVFLIHGHDELNLLKLEKLVRDRFGLQPIILAEQPGKSRTIIEKFEQEAATAGFAFALLTSDDYVRAGDNEYYQARPNVVFELGWFAGKLGRSRLCILLQTGTRIHSDLDGINRLEFKTSVTECSDQIERELRAAGLLGAQAAEA